MRRLIYSLACASLFAAGSAEAQTVSYNSAGASYVQLFDGLAPSGTGISWSNGNTLPGWHAFKATGSPNSYSAYSASTGSDFGEALYSYGIDGDRALGGVAGDSGNGNFLVLGLTNATGGSLGQFSLSYVGEQWRRVRNATQHSLNFGWKVGGNADDASGWNNVGSLDFTGPQAIDATPSVLNGNLAENRSARSGSANVSWGSNQVLWLRWADPNDSGFDHGLAIDDLTFSAQVEAANAVPEPASAWMLLAGLPVLARFRWKR